MVLLALWAGYRLWDYYMDAPWIRDGHVRADVVPVAPDVSGFVSEVLVRDNENAATCCSGSIGPGTPLWLRRCSLLSTYTDLRLSIFEPWQHSV